MNLFKYDSYKSYLRALIEDRREQRGFQTALAKAAGCQLSYLSQVLKTKLELTPDHAAGISEFLSHSPQEEQYFLYLLLHSRAGTPKLRERLGKSLRAMKSARQRISEQVGTSKPERRIEDFYFTSWMWSAVHLATSIESIATDEAISKRLGLPVGRVRTILARLEQEGLVKQSKGRWKFGSRTFHLPPESDMNELNHGNWRQRAVLDVQKAIPDSLHYTSVFTMSRADTEAMREMILQAIRKSRAIAEPSTSEEIFCFNCDFFAV